MGNPLTAFSSSPQKGRNLQLDILRGIAIFLVLGAHFKLPLPTGPLRGIAEFWQNHGFLGVDLFFVLSGFLIGGLLISEHTRHGRVNVMRFLIRRGLKIYPLYFIFLGYLILFPAFKAAVGRGDSLEVLMAGFGAYWPNFLFLHTYIGTNPAGHTWSLANEEHFYILLPLLIGILAAIGRMRWIMVACFLSLPLFIGIRTLSMHFNDPYAQKMVASHLRLDALFFGVGIRALAEYHPGLFSAMRPWRFVLLFCGLLLWLPAVFRHEMGQLYGSVGFTITMLGSGAFLIAILHIRASDLGCCERFLTPLAKLVAIVGVYSYAIYLVHVTVIRISEKSLAGRIYSLFGGATGTAWLLAVLMLSSIAIIAGMMASRLIEWPVIRLRDKLFPPPSASLPAPREDDVSTSHGSMNDGSLMRQDI
jgi:peptidoglycan/LPS O-acetylase OafA/YrhL